MIDKNKLFTRRALKRIEMRAKKLNHETDALVLQLIDHIKEMNKALNEIDKEFKDISKSEQAIRELMDLAIWSQYDEQNSAKINKGNS